MGKKEFAAAALDPKYETYVIHVVSLSSIPFIASALVLSPDFNSLDVYPSRKPQISSLTAEKAPTKVSAEYSDFANVFTLNLACDLPKHTGINDHAIKLVNGQQPTYDPIYSLGPMELKTLKVYI